MQSTCKEADQLSNGTSIALFECYFLMSFAGPENYLWNIELIIAHEKTHPVLSGRLPNFKRKKMFNLCTAIRGKYSKKKNGSWNLNRF